MTSDTESRLDRLEAELAHASNVAFGEVTNAIAIRIALEAVIATLGPATRQKAHRHARRENARQLSEGLAELQRLLRPEDKPWADFTAQQEEVRRELDRIFRDA